MKQDSIVHLREGAWWPLSGLPRRALLWVALVALLVIGQGLLVRLTLRYEEVKAQDEADETATLAAAELKRETGLRIQALQSLMSGRRREDGWQQDAMLLLATHSDVLHVERRAPDLGLLEQAETPYRTALFAQTPREVLLSEAKQACDLAERTASPSFSRSYFVPQGGGLGLEVVDLCLTEQQGGALRGYTLATVWLGGLLENALEPELARGYEISFTDADGTRLARAGVQRGSAVFVAQRPVELPGYTLLLKVDRIRGSPGLIPNLTVALVLGLSLALTAVVTLLLRDVRRRAKAESALAEALAFRKAMEDSLLTGLRARDLQGHIRYVNPAFCNMVGLSADKLLAASAAGEPPPYWPPERVAEYSQRQAARMRMVRPAPGQGTPAASPESQQGFETEFVRANGERFPVMIYEAPLVDGQGQHAGWMSAVLDMSEQRRVEELSRQQQERLQATARLATVGEMASLLSHELNQPLAAIASYASGTLNLLQDPDPQSLPLIQQAVGRMAEQAERAGRVIRSVHDYVRRREQAREAIDAAELLDGVLPLVRLQARKSGTRVEVEVGQPSPRVLVDRTMIEQVLLNLSRNGIQAMENHTASEQRVLKLQVQPIDEGRRVLFAVQDFGPGISPEVAQRLFTPFFTTRSEGMGLGLSLCRTVAEQHGGTLEYDTGTVQGGCRFRFSVPAAPPR